jgi:hypothetical protein
MSNHAPLFPKIGSASLLPFKTPCLETQINVAAQRKAHSGNDRKGMLIGRMHLKNYGIIAFEQKKGGRCTVLIRSIAQKPMFGPISCVLGNDYA